jgi:hypothetical protein
MRTSQVNTFCRIFELGDPAPVLREVWNRLDTIVSERNAIAHGRITPTEVGRAYSHQEINDLIKSWDMRWSDFLAWIERQASTRDFYRVR